MARVSLVDMLKTGAHFGHRTRFWNPKMAPYIYGERNGIHIINLEKTVQLFHDSLNFISKKASKNATVMFVGTKQSASKIIQEQAERANMPYVNHRWLGGMLTNYRTVRQSVKRLKELEDMMADGSLEKITKKEGLKLQREMAKLDQSLGGIKNMSGLPDILFIVDIKTESIALAEANKLGIPIVALVDTNSCPDNIDYVIPSNDDSSRAIKLFIESIVDTVLEARAVANVVSAKESTEDAAEEAASSRPKVVVRRQKKAVAAETVKSGVAGPEQKSDSAKTTKVVKKATAKATKADAKVTTVVDKPAAKPAKKTPATEDAKTPVKKTAAKATKKTAKPEEPTVAETPAVVSASEKS